MDSWNLKSRFVNINDKEKGYTISTILKLHEKIMKDLNKELGKMDLSHQEAVEYGLPTGALKSERYAIKNCIRIMNRRFGIDE